MADKVKVTEEELKEITRRVLGEYGVYLDVRVTSGTSASFTWGTITLPRRYLRFSPGELEEVLHHEVGHRVFWPGKPDREKLAYAIALEERVSMPPDLFSNLVADLFVERELIERRGQVRVDNDFRPVVRTTSTKDPLFWLLVLYFAEVCEELGLEFPEARQRAAKVLSPQRLEELETMAKEVLKIVDSALSDETKIRQLARALRRFYRHPSYDTKPLSMGRLPPRYRFSVPFKVDLGRENPVRDPEWLQRALQSVDVDVLDALISSSKVERVDPSMEGPRRPGAAHIGVNLIYLSEAPNFLVEAARLSMISKYLDLRGGASISSKVRIATWVPGMPPQRLDVERTVRTFGIVAPPIFSLAREEEPGRGSSGLRGMRRIIVVLDVSKSMEGSPLLRAKEAAVSTIEEARRRGLEAALIAFNGSWALWGPGYDYYTYEDVAMRLVAEGVTNLSQALEVASRLGDGLIVVITDAELTSVESVRVSRILNEVKHLVFWITEEEELPEALRGKRVIRVDSMEELASQVLEEVVTTLDIGEIQR